MTGVNDGYALIALFKSRELAKDAAERIREKYGAMVSIGSHFDMNAVDEAD